jgi:hypothetical protein
LSFVIAGQNGVQGYSGDGDQASLAVLHAPIAIHWDKVTGNKFIAEVHRCTIRMIDAAGIITTIAGVVGSCGKDEVDGLAAVSSQIWKPFALAMDSAGHLLIADFGSNRVLQVTIGGEMVTIAGKGSEDLGPAEGDEGLAVNAHVTTPSGLWVDRDDNIFVSESFGHRVRQIKASDGKIYNMIGKVDEKGTETSLWYPRGIWGDDSSQLKLYVPDSLNRRIVTIELPSASPSSAPSSLPSFHPSSVPSARPSDHPSSEPSSSPSYIAPAGPAVITKVAGNGGLSLGENGPATSISAAQPFGVWVDSNDNVYFAATYYQNIRKVGTDGKSNTIAGNANPGTPGFQDAVKGTDALFWNPRGIHGNGNFLAVGDFDNRRIRMVDLSTSDHTVTTIVGGCTTGCTTDFTGTHAGNTWALGKTYSPFIDGNYLYFTDYTKHVLLRTDLLSGSYDTKVFYGTWNSAGSNGLLGPAYLYVTTQGTSKSIYVTEEEGLRILKLNLNTAATSVSSFETVMGVYGNAALTADTSDSRGNKIYYPRGVWVDEPSSLLYYGEYGMGKVRTIDMANGYALKTFAGVPFGSSYAGPYDTTAPTTATLGAPSGVFGKGSKVYFTDRDHNLIRLVTLHPTSTSKGIHTHLRRI